MKRSLLVRLLVIGGLIVTVGFEVAAKDPMFKRWMVAGDPADEAILDYWARAEREELGAPALVDLGTMLFYRGFSADAIKVFKMALDVDPEMADAWFRIGLVNWREGDIREARQAYQRCLKIRSGHGWGNFYLGLLEEKDNNPSVAIERYRVAFRHAPELADPTFNPEVLYSKLQLAALVPVVRERLITRGAPFAWLEPAEVEAVRSRFEPTPTPRPTAVPAPSGQVTPPQVGTTSAGGGQGGSPAGAGAAAGSRSRSQRVSPGTTAGDAQPGTPTSREPRGGDEGTGAGGTSYLHIPDVSPEASLRAPGMDPGRAA